ncbi:orotidine-5'-phosphate decarboxylase [Metabacillus sp. GX 13764]|uniref:orotidine-5'-phosphate decarboxylase n=1 Tax=Metabacillus kandeliae TaxID=2900151 RepID=UPI001E35C325|nr:orotidine-5'-phosphate decarboxylase [Metabacillus kandeliae]MCD7033858.1 orotidine-5'-phosphate decarboxylase [Metabacillus kandeliae]
MKKKPLIIALDFSGKQELQDFLQKMGNEQLYVKAGMELFYGEGPEILYELKEKGHQIFLDLKLHDIPNTIRQAMKRLAGFSPDMVNVHAAGGRNMMEAALEGLEAGTESGAKRPLCIAVTQLTSTSPALLREELLIQTPMKETVLHYAKNAYTSGLDGIVCSVHESEEIHAAITPQFLTVTPGIRLITDSVNDQIRVADPEEARTKNVSAIVVGRSITASNDPLAAYIRVKKLWEGAAV